MSVHDEGLVDSWRTRRGLSEHSRLEVAYAARAGHQPGGAPPLAPGAPVPGCSCPRCLTYAAGGDALDAELVRSLVHHLADRPPEERPGLAESVLAAWTEEGCTLPRAGVLVELARRVPGAVRSLPDDSDPLPVEEARRVPLVDVCRRLGLGEPVRPHPSSRELRVRCPLHADENPSLTVSPEKGVAGLWFCFPCGEGGDGIELVERARRLDFVEAVKWIVAESY